MTVTTLAYIPSPDQGVWFLGAVPIRAYALCIIGGIIAALVIGDRRWEARGGERGVIYDIALWAVPFGLVGGRLYHVLTDWPTYFGAGGAGLGAAFRIWDGGLGIWGAVALGGVGAWIGCRRRGIPLPAFGDAIAPGIILAQAIGRLGNYFNQELFGRTTTMPWGLEIYERRDAAGFRDSLNGVSTGEVVSVVHPTFLYELLWNVLIFALLIWLDRRYKLGHGRVFALYVAGYCLGRFWIELMRADPATLIAGIRVNSFTSTFIFIAAVVYVMVAPEGREDPATLRGNADIDEESVVDDVATEVIEMGAFAGVVAAAKRAGADSDSAKPDADDQANAGEASVADAADGAYDVEKPVETEVLVAVESEPESAQEVVEESAVEESESDSVTAEPADEAVEPAEAAGESDSLDTGEPVVVDEQAEADEPAGEAEAGDEPAETEESPEAEAADGDSDDAELAVEELAVVGSDETPTGEGAEVANDAAGETEESPAEAEAAEAEALEAETEGDAPETEAEAAEAEPTEGNSGDADVAVEGPTDETAEEATATPADAPAESAATEEPPVAEPTKRWWKHRR
ncbi:MAG: prolipoprotein diacylglyceryl transferase [Mycobacterium sp.]